MSDNPGLTRPEIDGMQTDLIALMKAWTDRGIHPADSAVLLMATSQVMVKKFTNLALENIIAALRKQWETADE